ncbi:hypothetical protein MMB17_04825 [Methylobacterium organophilum]|uniref:hypothetical protein n=1 Tax=Methylobacterium organophilum TaxID=410 RepID=UPI001F13F042|nr:hypothetical protein [Methylobacterium organophilum]UMY18654.1 hypothetical protein MMB17_04825 [Methylobacterium organophilum]
MYKDSKLDTEILFATADATWRSEAARVLDLNPDDPDLTRVPAARGEPDTVLRLAFDVRERAYGMLLGAIRRSLH